MTIGGGSGARKIEGLFDVVIAGAFEPFQTNKKFFPLYEKVATELGKMGEKVFIPHQKISTETIPTEVFTTVYDAIINSKLVLVNISEESSDVGAMACIANQASVPQIYFQEQGKRASSVRACGIKLDNVVEYKTEQQGVEKIMAAVRDFYKE